MCFCYCGSVVESTVTKSFEMSKMVVNFGQLKPRLDGITSSGMHGGEGRIGVDLFVGISHLVVSSSKSIQVGSNSPIIKISGVVFDKGIGGSGSSDELNQPV